MTSAVRVLLGFAVVGAGFLSGSFQFAGAQSTGEVAQAAEEETERCWGVELRSSSAGLLVCHCLCHRRTAGSFQACPLACLLLHV